MCAARTNLAMQYDRPGWRAAAERAFGFVGTTLGVGDDQLGHSWRAGKLVFPGLLDDYANMLEAALALYEATGKPNYLAQAQRWGAKPEGEYDHCAHGGYCPTAVHARQPAPRTPPAATN